LGVDFFASCPQFGISAASRSVGLFGVFGIGAFQRRIEGWLFIIIAQFDLSYPSL